MKKVILQGFVIILSFFLTWHLLSNIDWVQKFQIQKITKQTEEEIGDKLWEHFKKGQKEENDTLVVNALNQIAERICSENKIDRKSIRLHILQNYDINAFAMPNGHLVINTGLINGTDNAEALSGVIAHEIAHIHLGHIMKKLAKELSVAALTSLTTGSAGREVQVKIIETLTSSAFDRRLEKAADLKAADFLVKAKIDPVPFSDFLLDLSEKETGGGYMEWLSTHPASSERAIYVRDLVKNLEVKYEPVIDSATWNSLKTIITDK